MKKQTAVQWLQESLLLHLTFQQEMQFEGLFQQALEMEKPKEEFAIGFAEWVIENKILSSKIPTKELLEIYKETL